MRTGGNAVGNHHIAAGEQKQSEASGGKNGETPEGRETTAEETT